MVKISVNKYVSRRIETIRKEVETNTQRLACMHNCYIDIDDRITGSLIGPNSIITSNKNNKPKARRFLIGEQSQITL